MAADAPQLKVMFDFRVFTKLARHLQHDLPNR
jgi:hypothetical protein